MNWHDCDGKIGRFLRYSVNGWDGSGNEPCYFMMVVNGEGAVAIPVWHCPACGEKLEKRDDVR